MQVSGFWGIFGLGVFGGILGEAIKWYRIRESRFLPDYVKSPLYWLITAVIILSGGILSSLYGLEPKNAILIVNIGISSPLIIQALAQSHPLLMPKGIESKKDAFHRNIEMSILFKRVTKTKILFFLAGK